MDNMFTITGPIHEIAVHTGGGKKGWEPLGTAPMSGDRVRVVVSCKVDNVPTYVSVFFAPGEVNEMGLTKLTKVTVAIDVDLAEIKTKKSQFGTDYLTIRPNRFLGEVHPVYEKHPFAKFDRPFGTVEYKEVEAAKAAKTAEPEVNENGDS